MPLFERKILRTQSIFVIFLIISSFFGGGVFVYKIIEKINEEKWIYVYTGASGISYNTFNSLHIGNKEILNDKELAEILNITLLNDGSYVDALFKIKLRVTLDKSSRYLFKNHILIKGNPIDLYINNTALRSWVLSINTSYSEPEQKKALVKLMIPRVEEWFLPKVEIGDVERSPSGLIIGEVISKEVHNSKTTIFNPFTNKVEKKDDLVYYDVFLDLRLLVEEMNGRMYYSLQEVSPGKYINVETDRFLFRGLVDSVEFD